MPKMTFLRGFCPLESPGYAPGFQNRFIGVSWSRATRQKKPEVDRTINKGTSYPPSDLIPIYKVFVAAKIAVSKVLSRVPVAGVDSC